MGHVTDDANFDSWYAATFPRIAGSMALAAGDRHEGEDAAAEAFARAYARWDRVSQMASPEAYVHRTAYNLIKRRARRRSLERRVLRRESARLDHVPPPGVPTDLWHTVAVLPTQMRTAVGLRYVADLTQAEIADVMGIAPGTVAAHLHAARKRLADLLGEPEEATHG